MNRGKLAFILVILLLSLVQGCGTGFAPVTDQSMGARQVGVPVASQASASRPAPLPNPGSYSVNRGDTLYSIAWRYGLDYREVAQWNKINDRFQIYPGQVLRLTRPSSSNTVAPRIASRPVAQTQPTSVPVPSADPPKSQATRPQQPTSQPAVSPQQPSVSTGQPVWRWPANGQVIRRFSAAEGGSKGIDIAGNLGDPVVAAADGRVVYAGSGLLGYGNLVIVNHNREFLSAYAHNSRILVSENDMVKSGDKIAEMGQSGADRVQLHFEIRRNGKPVDPTSHLPRR